MANDYDLSINKYKEVVYEKVDYEPTEVIMGKIEAIEARIQREFAELKKLLLWRRRSNIITEKEPPAYTAQQPLIHRVKIVSQFYLLLP